MASKALSNRSFSSEPFSVLFISSYNMKTKSLKIFQQGIHFHGQDMFKGRTWS
jgi:hypothetical protein